MIVCPEEESAEGASSQKDVSMCHWGRAQDSVEKSHNDLLEMEATLQVPTSVLFLASPFPHPFTWSPD